jgi:hypothetical protein
MHESERQELRRVVLRVLQKDFHALTTAQFENWTKQVLAKLEGLEQHLTRLDERLAALEQQAARPQGAAPANPSALAAEEQA